MIRRRLRRASSRIACGSRSGSQVSLDAGIETSESLPAMTEADVRVLVDRYRAGWFGHGLDAIMGVVSDDIVFHNITSGERVEGAAAFRAHVAEIHGRWPDWPSRSALYLTADSGVAEWTARATTPDGRRVEWDGIDVINCRDGQIARNAVYSSGHAPRVLE